MNGSSTPNVAPVMRAANVSCPPDVAFRAFTDEIGAWWPLRTHGLFGDESGGVQFRDGQLVEIATDGRTSTWGEVVEWRPPELVALSWHPGGSPDGPVTRVEIRFEPDDGGTRVVLVHSGWEAFGQDGLERRRPYAGPNAWGQVLGHYADSADEPLASADLGELRAAYDTFFDQVERGGFGPPPEGEWSSDQVIAHVALNDLAMIAVCRSIVNGEPIAFENRICQDPEALDAIIERFGDDLVGFGRVCAAHVLTAVRRLRPEQLDEPIECRLDHDGERVLETSMPWQQVVVATQATRHLPAHTGQLADLRP